MTTVAAQCACGVPAGTPMPRCGACPLAAASVVAWAAGSAPTQAYSPAAGQVVGGRFVPAQREPTRYLESRWRKGPTTFGPLGRIVATFLMLLPVPVLLLTLAIGVGIAGMVAYCGVLLPMGLKHIWAKARIPLGTFNS